MPWVLQASSMACTALVKAGSTAPSCADGNNYCSRELDHEVPISLDAVHLKKQRRILFLHRLIDVHEAVDRCSEGRGTN